MRKVGDLFEFVSTGRRGTFHRDNHYLLQANCCHEIISDSFYQSNDTPNDDEMFTMPHCEPQEDGDSDGNDQSHHTSVLSIIHGIMYAPSDGVKWMPKHIALGSTASSSDAFNVVSRSIAQGGSYTTDKSSSWTPH